MSKLKNENKVYLIKFLCKRFFYDFIFILCICALTSIYAFINSLNIALYSLSCLYGSCTFFIANVLYTLLSFNAKNGYLTASYVLYRLIYATIFKYLFIALLFIFCFKFLFLINQIVIASFCLCVLFGLFTNFCASK